MLVLASHDVALPRVQSLATFAVHRQLVAHVASVDILRRHPRPVLSMGPFEKKCMLIFLNIARDLDILSEGEMNSGRLSGVVDDLKDILDDSGTIVIALKSSAWHQQYLARE